MLRVIFDSSLVNFDDKVLISVLTLLMLPSSLVNLFVKLVIVVFIVEMLEVFVLTNALTFPTEVATLVTVFPIVVIEFAATVLLSKLV